MKANSYIMTDKGSVRDHNEDSVIRLDDYGILAVADGMGGHQYGEIASKLACDSIKEWFDSFRNNKTFHRNDLATSFQFANKKVYNQLGKYRSGTTLVAMQIFENFCIVANSGDSRCYLIRSGKIKQVTEDHSVVNEIKKTNPLAKDEDLYSYRNMINNAIGLQEEVKVDEFMINIQKGDVILLCSDGLNNELSDEEILNCIISAKRLSLETTCLKLIINACNNRGRDNISVAVARVK